MTAGSALGAVKCHKKYDVLALVALVKGHNLSVIVDTHWGTELPSTRRKRVGNHPCLPRLL